MDVGSIKNSLNPVLANDSKASIASVSRHAADTVKVGDAGGASKAAAPEQAEASRDQVESAVSTIQEFVQSVRGNINFSVEDTSGRVVVKVTDSNSGDVIRQIPSEEALQLAESLEEVRSLLFKAEA